MATVIFQDSMSAAVGVLLHNHVPTVKGTSWLRHEYNKPPNQPATVAYRSDGTGFYPQIYGAMIANDPPLTAEYDVEADFIIIDGFGNAGLIGRASATAQTYYHAYYEDGSWTLIRWLNGLSTNLWTLPLVMAPGTYRVKLQLRDATKKLFVDDGGGYDELFSSADNAISAKGYGGFRSAFQYGDNEGKQFTNFTLTDTATPVGRPRRLIL